MRITTIEGDRVWLNPNRVDSMKTVTAPQDNIVVESVRIQTPNAVFVCTDSFDSLTEQLDKARQRQ